MRTRMLRAAVLALPTAALAGCAQMITLDVGLKVIELADSALGVGAEERGPSETPDP